MGLTIRSHARTQDLAFFGFRYEDQGRIGDPCTYCGQVSSVFDHVPPLVFVSRLPAQELRYYRLRLFPTCMECNSILGGLALTTLSERRSRIKERLERKYARILAIPSWTEEELSKLSNYLASDIRRHLAFANSLRARIAWS
jgi:hypothetical protein